MSKQGHGSLYETAIGFLTFLNDDEINLDDNLNKLNMFLDEISFAYHSTPDVKGETFADTQKQNYTAIRSLVIRHFPELGLYNLPQAITDHIGQTDIVVGDAVDDLTDIVCDLSGVIWCFEHTDENDALWHLRFGYQHHWGKHLRTLQLYLYSLQFETGM